MLARAIARAKGPTARFSKALGQPSYLAERLHQSSSTRVFSGSSWPNRGSPAARMVLTYGV